MVEKKNRIFVMTRKNTLILLSLVLVLTVAAAMGFILNRQEKLLIRSPLLLHEAPLITYMTGGVFLFDTESEQWREPEVGDRLEEGARIKTEADGEIDIRLNAATLIRLDSDSLFELTASNLNQYSLHLHQGRLFGKFQKLFPSQKIQVDTDDMIAGIRGTELVFEKTERASAVYALSGITEVMSPDYPEDKLLLSFQKKVTIPQGERPGQPEAMSPERIKLFQEILNSIHKEKVFLVTRAIHFEADRSVILEQSLPALEKLYGQIDRTDYSLRIAGHTAAVGTAGAQYALSLQRAEAVKGYLVERGIQEKRLTVAGYGGTKPVADNATEEGRALNRRVEFIILE